MLNGWRRWSAAAVLTLAASSVPAHAASIGVSPILLDVGAGESVSGIRVNNSGGDDAQAVSVQVRLLRWQQDDTGDVYAPAEAVVASPPMTRIAPGAEHLVRIVRSAAQPVVGEESYRLLLDQLPEPGEPQVGMVNMLIRHSVPVFFAAPNATPAQPQWRIARATHEGQDGWQVTVENHGDKRLRLVGLELHGEDGALVAQREGLVGYVLGHARMGFFVAATPEGAGSSGASPLRVSVHSEQGLIESGSLPVAASP